jgi:hypothetical protein
MPSPSAAGAPLGFREIFRYRKGQRTRTYGVTALDERAHELWVVASGPGRNAVTARKLVQLAGEDELSIFLDDVEQQLRRGHWTPVR